MIDCCNFALVVWNCIIFKFYDVVYDDIFIYVSLFNIMSEMSQEN